MTNAYQRKLHSWYELNKRNLPWRDTRNAYHIWLSEIILQQTRIEQGEQYFIKFKAKYPRIENLANASENEVLNLWQGLGYYSRARNLHKTAKIIANQYQGKFPSNYRSILELPGIGPYTAAAISSFAFQLPHAVVDGNVYRFLSRLNGIRTPIDSTAGKKEFQHLADRLLDEKNNDNYNQAIMEFGARHCTKHNPKCSTCPFQDECIAYRDDLTSILPFKEKKIKKTTISTSFGFYLNDQNEVLLEKRDDQGIWKNMFQLPTLSEEETRQISHKPLFEKKHLLTHQTHFISIYANTNIPFQKHKHRWMKLDELKNNPFPQPFVEFFKQLDLEV